MERYKKVLPGDSYVLKGDGKKIRITHTEETARAINNYRKNIVSNPNILSVEEKLAKEIQRKATPLHPKALEIHRRRLKILEKAYRNTYPLEVLPEIFWQKL